MSSIKAIASCAHGVLQHHEQEPQPAPLGRGDCRFTDDGVITVTAVDGPHRFTLEFDIADPENCSIGTIERLDGTRAPISIEQQDRMAAFADYLISLIYDN